MAHIQLITSHTTDSIASGSVESNSTPLIVSVSPVSNYFLLNRLLNYVIMCRCVLVLSLGSAVGLHMDGDSRFFFLLDLIRIFFAQSQVIRLSISKYVYYCLGRQRCQTAVSPLCWGLHMRPIMCVLVCVQHSLS